MALDPGRLSWRAASAVALPARRLVVAYAAVLHLVGDVRRVGLVALAELGARLG